MMIGVLTLELRVREAQSLKDKRRIIQSIKTRIRNSFNVSVAEVGHLDDRQRCRLAVVMVSRETRPLHSQLDKMVDLVRRSAGLTLIDYGREIL